LETKYSGESVPSKIERVRKALKKKDVDAYIATALDEIAWLFNIRGTDVNCNPVVISYAIITPDSVKFFVKKEKLTKEAEDHLKDVEIFEYDSLKEHLQILSDNKSYVLIDKNIINHWIVKCLGPGCKFVSDNIPVASMKSIKNQKELSGFKKAHIRDGVALVKFLYWLEKTVPHENITEISAGKKLTGFRSEQELYQEDSFNGIIGYQDHGAIVHYNSIPESDVKIEQKGLLLIDSGGQYFDGTTDITRTIAMAEPTSEQKDRFTRVLMGHIDLTLAKFPKGTAGKQLDTIARKSLWDVGENYGHGTGHGVGHFLNVHEGPHSISHNRCKGIALEPGMVVTNEPGYYKAGEYGIRIENIIYVVKDEELSSEQEEFYRFENMTLCPLDLKLIESSLLTIDQKTYLNNYHKEVYDKLEPLLNEEEKDWLEKATLKIN